MHMFCLSSLFEITDYFLFKNFFIYAGNIDTELIREFGQEKRTLSHLFMFVPVTT